MWCLGLAWTSALTLLLWIQLPASSGQGRPLSSQRKLQQQFGGREKAPPSEAEGTDHSLPGGRAHDLSGLGVASLLFQAGLECGNQILAPWCCEVVRGDIPQK